MRELIRHPASWRQQWKIILRTLGLRCPRCGIYVGTYSHYIPAAGDRAAYYACVEGL